MLRYHDAALSLMTVQALSYFIPAYLIQSILDPEELDVVYDYVIWSLSPYEEKDRWKEERTQSLLNSYSSAQTEVLIEYLQYRKENDNEFSIPYIDALLELITENL